MVATSTPSGKALEVAFAIGREISRYLPAVALPFELEDSIARIVDAAMQSATDGGKEK
jgi:hypothetical protein